MAAASISKLKSSASPETQHPYQERAIGPIDLASQLAPWQSRGTSAGGPTKLLPQDRDARDFSPTEGIEVATADESFRVLLSIKDGNLTLQDSRTVLAVLDPMRLLGPSAFGLLKFRPVTTDGIEGHWQPLVNLVRLPTLRGFRCPASEKQCTLSGDNLFLLDSVSVDPDFADSVAVPEGFVGDALTIPPPKAKTLYIKLRDDPAVVDVAALPALTSQ